MPFDAFGTHELETRPLGTEVSDGLFFVLVARNVIGEVGLHVFKTKGFVHDNFVE